MQFLNQELKRGKKGYGKIKMARTVRKEEDIQMFERRERGGRGGERKIRKKRSRGGRDKLDDFMQETKGKVPERGKTIQVMKRNGS